MLLQQRIQKGLSAILDQLRYCLIIKQHLFLNWFLNEEISIILRSCQMVRGTDSWCYFHQWQYQQLLTVFSKYRPGWMTVTLSIYWEQQFGCNTEHTSAFLILSGFKPLVHLKTVIWGLFTMKPTRWLMLSSSTAISLQCYDPAEDPLLPLVIGLLLPDKGYRKS